MRTVFELPKGAVYIPVPEPSFIKELNESAKIDETANKDKEK